MKNTTIYTLIQGINPPLRIPMTYKCIFSERVKSFYVIKPIAEHARKPSVSQNLTLGAWGKCRGNLLFRKIILTVRSSFQLSSSLLFIGYIGSKTLLSHTIKLSFRGLALAWGNHILL